MIQDASGKCVTLVVMMMMMALLLVAPAYGTDCGEVTCENVGVLASCDTAKSLRLDNCVSLAAVSARYLTVVKGSILIQNNPVLKSLELPALTMNNGWFYVQSNAQLAELSLQTFGGNVVYEFHVEDCPLLTSLNMPAFYTANSLFIKNVGVDTIDLPALSVQSVNIMSNANLREIHLDKLTYGGTAISSNPALTKFTMTSMSYSLGINVAGCPNVQINLPALQTIYGLELNDVANADLPKIITINGSLKVKVSYAFLVNTLETIGGNLDAEAPSTLGFRNLRKVGGVIGVVKAYTIDNCYYLFPTGICY